MTPRRTVVAVVVAVSVALAAACGGEGGDVREAAGDAPAATGAATAPRRPAGPPAPRPAPETLPGLPAETAGFMGWDRLNRVPIPPDSPQARRVGVDAHRGVKNVHVSVPLERLIPGRPYPDGTVIVKAAGEDPLRPTLVAVMRKVAGSDPAHGDWRFEEYTRATPGERFDGPLTGAVCWSCHAIAAETDWVFTVPGR